MSVKEWAPQQAPDVAAWTNETNALPGTEPVWGLWAVHPGTNDATWLVLTDFDHDGGTVPNGDVVVGIEIIGKWGLNIAPDGSVVPDIPSLTSKRIEVCVSKDGVNPAGVTWVLDTVGEFTVGGPSNLHGATWSLSEINSSSLSILIRLPTHLPNEDTDGMPWRSVDYGRLKVYHTAGGGSLTLPRETVLQRTQFGRETTKGTPATCNKRFMAMACQLNPQGDFKVIRSQGNKLATKNVLMREWGGGTFQGHPTYDEMGYVLASIVATPSSSGTGVVDQRNLHVFRFNNRAASTFYSYTLEYGDKASRAHRVAYAVFTELSMEFTNADATMSGSFISRKITDGVTMAAGTNEVQTATRTGTGTGAWSLYGDEAPAVMTFDATTTAGALQTHLESIAAIGAGNILVAGAAGGPYTITFQGTLAGEQVPLLEFRTVTGGMSFAVVQTTAGGVTELDYVPIVPNDEMAFYLADTYATLGANKLEEASMATFGITDRYDVNWTVDRAVGGWKRTVETPPTVSFTLMVQADANGMALLTAARTRARKFIRIESIGPVIGATSDTHQFIVDSCCEVSEMGQFEDQSGIYAYRFGFSSVEDKNWGNSFIMKLQNGMVNYQ
jgi:hypothetical protein